MGCEHLGEDHLPFKATAAIFGCIPDYREPSPGLDLTVLTKFEESAMESDILLAGDLGQDIDQSDADTSYILTTEVDLEMDVLAKQLKVGSRRLVNDVIFKNLVV